MRAFIAAPTPVALLLSIAIAAIAPLAIVSAAVAQDAPAPASSRPVVLVVDPGQVRINAERLRRTLETVLGREVVRITDPQANDAAGTLTLAHESRARWLVRFDGTGASASTYTDVLRPGQYDTALAVAARRAITEAEAAIANPPPRPAAADPWGEDAFYVAWADEILDPFANLPPPPRREMAIASEVLDPFSPLGSRRSVYSEVLDPWGR